jgi:murein DD-endopeptidase MepM/ murein hydrolase activator NlpD
LNGTVHGATLTTDKKGNANSAYEFDGVTPDYIDVPNTSALNPVNFTIGFWVSPYNSNNDAIELICNYHWIPSPNGYYIYYRQASKRIGAGLVKNNEFYQTENSLDLGVNTWTYLTITYNGNTLSIYANAIMASSLSGALGYNPSPLPNLCFGDASHSHTTPVHHYAGKLDNIRFYNRALTDEEVKALYDLENGNRQVLSPVAGPLTQEINNHTFSTSTWSFNQFGSTHHTQQCDYFAWDANLGVGNYDEGRPIYSVDLGIVEDINETGGFVLIKHNDNGQNWWTGYRHMKNIRVAIGQPVTKATVLGLLGDAGMPGQYHLHFAVYESNQCSNSVDATILARQDQDGDWVPDDVDMCLDNPGLPNDIDFDGCGDKIEGLMLEVALLEIEQGIRNSLGASLLNANRSIINHNDNAARGQLGAFINKVQAHSGNAIAANTADYLIQYARNIINLL